MTNADFVGRLVIFTYHHGEKEEGIATSANDRYVFVRFPTSQTSQACEPSMLTLVQP
jgi:hypothetical protein